MTKNNLNTQQVDILDLSGKLLRKNYIHQIKETISAYSHSLIVVGEALQNSIDAVCRKPRPSEGKIDLHIDFDEGRIVIKDNGIGFPRDASLLYLGGSDKSSTPKSMGQIGVGIKVVLFSSTFFSVRSKPRNGKPWKFEVKDVCNFETFQNKPLNLEVADDTKTPIESRSGTQVEYILKDTKGKKTFISSFIEEMKDKCFASKRQRGKSLRSDFSETIKELTKGKPKEYPSPIAALLSVFLRRFTYVGDVQTSLGGKKDLLPTKGIKLNVSLESKKHPEDFKDDWTKIFGTKQKQIFSIPTEYLHVEKMLDSLPKSRQAPTIIGHPDLTLGGKGMYEKIPNKFHLSILASSEDKNNPSEKFSDYEKLLLDSDGGLPDSETMKKYREKMFPKVNGIILTIGHIPHFDKYLPGGSRRILSCNGIVTDHEIEVQGGRNIDYTRRCFDLIIDIDAELNYGKRHVTAQYNNLIGHVRSYIDEAYKRVIQPSARKWTGKQRDEDEEYDNNYLRRKDIGLEDFVLRKEPKDENDVIALFFEMCGKNIIPVEHFRVFGLSGKSQYDGKAAIRTKRDNEESLHPADDSKLKIIEFKVRASNLIDDFKFDRKKPEDLDLLVAWDKGSIDESFGYALRKIEESKLYGKDKVFPKVTMFIEDLHSGELQTMLLKDIVEEIKEERKSMPKKKTAIKRKNKKQ